MEDKKDVRSCALCGGTGAINSGVAQLSCMGCNGTGRAKSTQVAVPQSRIEKRLAALEEQIIAMREVLRIVTTYSKTNGTPPKSAVDQVRLFFGDEQEGGDAL